MYTVNRSAHIPRRENRRQNSRSADVLSMTCSGRGIADNGDFVPRVMENGIKSPSLRRGPRVCATAPEPTTALKAKQ